MDKHELEQAVARAVEQTKATTPLAGSITNAVTMNLVANAQIAVGGSAAMVYLEDEAVGLSEVADAFYVNAGTLLPPHEQSIPAVAQHVQQLGKSLVLDPVGIGLGSLRTRVLVALKPCKPAIVRGNASEIIALANLWDLAGVEAAGGPRGVDAVDAVDDALAAALAIARFTKGAVAISGETDVVTDGTLVARSHGGSVMMTNITGAGCSQGGVIAIYAAVADPFAAALAGVQVYNLAGSRAAAATDAPASFQVAFLDELFRATPQDVAGNPFELAEVGA
ncbi:MAG: hydroxyethylthiazole kinase [Coriobacteriaceae bacterium]|nr:hydroxyethylthiazole kinase [Coriobacteriaceae bacterium]